MQLSFNLAMIDKFQDIVSEVLKWPWYMCADHEQLSV